MTTPASHNGRRIRDRSSLGCRDCAAGTDAAAACWSTAATAKVRAARSAAVTATARVMDHSMTAGGAGHHRRRPAQGGGRGFRYSGSRNLPRQPGGVRGGGGGRLGYSSTKRSVLQYERLSDTLEPDPVVI